MLIKLKYHIQERENGNSRSVAILNFLLSLFLSVKEVFADLETTSFFFGPLSVLYSRQMLCAILIKVRDKVKSQHSLSRSSMYTLQKQVYGVFQGQKPICWESFFCVYLYYKYQAVEYRQNSTLLQNQFYFQNSMKGTVKYIFMGVYCHSHIV